MVKLSAQERLFRDTREDAFQRQVTDLASALGWSWVHFRPGRTERGWVTPVQGPLGKGWPDLQLVHTQQRRVLFIELKRERSRCSVEQFAVLLTLAAAGAEVGVWRPSDLEGTVLAVLGGEPAPPLDAEEAP